LTKQDFIDWISSKVAITAAEDFDDHITWSFYCAREKESHLPSKLSVKRRWEFEKLLKTNVLTPPPPPPRVNHVNSPQYFFFSF
jgi:hypothetical protein